MGLDMYLDIEKSFYSPAWDEDRKKTEEEKMNEKLRELFPDVKRTDNLDYVKVSFEVGYWRKANAIHKWFVDNCQDGQDDCKRYYVRKDKLKELRELCKNVLDKSDLNIENPETANTLLPTQGGFFFGNTDYDEYYCSDIKSTLKIIDYCLSLDEGWDFYYHSSW